VGLLIGSGCIQAGASGCIAICAPAFRQARLCADFSVADVWMTATDAALLTGAFYVPWLGLCCYFNFADSVYTTLGGTLYARADVTASADCTACLPCFTAGAIVGALPATVTITLPTVVNFAGCPTPQVGSPSLTSQVLTRGFTEWDSPAISTFATIAGWRTRPAVITGTDIYCYLAASSINPFSPHPCSVWEFGILYRTEFFPFSSIVAVWQRRIISNSISNLYGGYYFAGISSVTHPAVPTACPGATATPFLYVSP
jgi:hypothetical protein